MYRNRSDLYFASPPEDDWITYASEEDGKPVRALASLLEPPKWPWKKIFIFGEDSKSPALQHYSTGNIIYFSDYPGLYPEHQFRTEITTVAELKQVQGTGPRLPRVFRQTPSPEPLAVERRAKREAKMRGPLPVRSFSPSQIEPDPLDALARGDVEAKLDLYRHCVRLMCQESDWDESLRIAGPKIVDQLLFMVDGMIWNVEQTLRDTVRQMEDVIRASKGSDISLHKLSELEETKRGLRCQQRHYQLMQHAFRQEREPVITKSGLKWSDYEDKKRRRDRAQAERMRQKRLRNAQLALLTGKSDFYYRQWLEWDRRMENRLASDGIDADGASHEEARREHQEDLAVAEDGGSED